MAVMLNRSPAALGYSEDARLVYMIGNQFGLSGAYPDRERASGLSHEKDDRDGDGEPDGEANRLGIALVFRCSDECVDEFARQEDGGDRQ